MLQSGILWLRGTSGSSPDGFRKNENKASLLHSCTDIYLLFRFVPCENHTYYYLPESEHIINRLINFGYTLGFKSVMSSYDLLKSPLFVSRETAIV